MRVTLALLLIAVVAVAAQQPAAPIKKAKSFAGGAATCTPGTGVVSADATSGNACAPCLAGYYQANTGTLACTACPAGTWSPIGSRACYTCPAGTISGVAADSCEECGYGTVTTGYTQSNAFTGFNRGMTSGDITTNTRCFPCDVNWYQPKAAQTVCMPCPANTNTAGAQGQGACFAASGGNTVAGNGGAAPGGAPAALLETHQSPAKATKATKATPAAPAAKSTPAKGTKKAGPAPGVGSGSASGSNSVNVKSTGGPQPPITKSKRGDYKPRAKPARFVQRAMKP